MNTSAVRPGTTGGAPITTTSTAPPEPDPIDSIGADAATPPAEAVALLAMGTAITVITRRRSAI